MEDLDNTWYSRVRRYYKRLRIYTLIDDSQIKQYSVINISGS